MMYYNAQEQISTTNVCGYGNHDACESKDCQCTFPQHAFPEHGSSGGATPHHKHSKSTSSEVSSPSYS